MAGAIMIDLIAAALSPELLSSLALVGACGLGGLLYLLGVIRKPGARPSAPDPRLQAQADRAEAAEVRGIQAREDAIKAEADAVRAEPSEIEKARRAARMRG